MGGFFNFEDRLSFYGQYHNTKINKLVHLVFVPTIFWTVLVWFSNFALFPQVEKYDPIVPLNWSLVIVVVYGLYYALLEPFAGLVYFPVLLALQISAAAFLVSHGPVANWYSLYIHIFSWLVQFAGHFFVEKRAPALLDNLEQALLLAPFFVWMEVLFSIGYRPSLRARLDKRVHSEIEQWKRNKSKTKKQN